MKGSIILDDIKESFSTSDEQCLKDKRTKLIREWKKSAPIKKLDGRQRILIDILPALYKEKL